MPLRKFNPRTPGQRQLVIVDRSGLHRGKPVKSLTEGLTKSFQKVEMPSTINRIGSMFTGFFNTGPVAGLADAEGSDTEMYGRYFHAMQEQGVYIAPSQFEAGFVSTAHTEADVDATIAKAEAALSTLR